MDCVSWLLTNANIVCRIEALEKKGKHSMTHPHSWDTEDEQDNYTLPSPDPLMVLSSTRRVLEVGKHAWINPTALEALSTQWIQSGLTASTASSAWYEQYHFNDGTARTVNWILLLDALNFCFWAEAGQERWSIAYNHTVLNGYWAEAASLTRAVEEGIPLWDAAYLSTITEDTIAHIFRGSLATTPAIPLFEQRVHNAREVGQVLLARYDGQFTNAIEQAAYNAVTLVQLLARDFSSFRDIAFYHSHAVHFLKRAQICVADLFHAFHATHWGALSNIDQLTCFADYKVPQVLRHYHVIEYAPTLAQRIDRQELLAAGCPEELEIRAATVWACELLRRSLARQGVILTAIAVDQQLWLAGQHLAALRPYHRTRTIYY